MSGLFNAGDRRHAAFLAWLTHGATGDLDPALAAHAVGCESCRNAIAAVDALATMDTARTDLPAVAPPAPSASTRWPLVRHVFPAAAVLVLALAQVAGSGTVLAPGAPVGGGPLDIWPFSFGASGSASGSDSPSPSAGEASASAPVIASGEPQAVPFQSLPPGISVPAATANPSTPTSPGASQPGSSSSPPAPTPPPSPILTPPPSPILTPPPTPPPPPPTPEPTPPPPPPTPEPTPPPPPPTPEPTATPLAANCTNGIDDDGDLLTDLADPGCLLFGDEFLA